MDFSVFFAGTAGSIPTARRGLPAVLVRRGADRILFDCGEGTQRQLVGTVGLADLTARHKFLGALRGESHWPPPKEVRATVEELGLTFIKFGQVLALRRDLLPDAYIDELELLHDQLPAMSIGTVRATVEVELGAPLT